jgi:predicted GTPase
MLEKSISEELKEQISKLEAPNIAIIGRTGVGKSTIINTVFGANIAKVGAGLPITQGFVRYPAEGYDNGTPVVVYDSAGYEAGKEEKFVSDVHNFINQKQSLGADKQIHLVWYVINASSARVELFEKNIIDQINQVGIPVIIILSQCDRAKPEEISEIKATIEKFELNKVYYVIEVAASPLIFQGEPICKKFGLHELVHRTIERLPEMYTDAVIAMQVVDLRSKRKVVWKYISTAATACFAANASPLPVGTAALITSQTGLCMAIASVYGYKEIGEFLVSIGTVAAFNTILQAALGDLISILIPAAGVFAGVSSASYIVVFGLACTTVFEKIAQDKIGKTKEEIASYLKDNFKREFQRNSLVRIQSLEELEILKRNFLDPPQD